jgi:RNA ligase (TIGR02306 family)
MLGVVKYDPEALEEEKLVLAKGKKYGPFVNYLLKFAFFRWLLLPKRKRPGKWPDFVSKTDEIRVQNLTYVFDKYQGLPVYVTVKKDGQSVTFFYNKKEFGVCSRNLRLPRPQKLKGKYVTEQSKYWQSAEKYDVEAKLKKASKDYGINLYIQAESCGPGIQGNKCNYKELKLFVFNVYDITHKKYFDFYELRGFCQTYGFDMVPLCVITAFNWQSSDELVEYAKGFDPDGDKVLREGVVIRSLLAMPPDKGMANMWSLKVINPDFSVKWGQNDYSEKK